MTTALPIIPAFTIPVLTTPSAVITQEANAEPEASPSVVQPTIVNKPDEAGKFSKFK